MGAHNRHCCICCSIIFSLKYKDNHIYVSICILTKILCILHITRNIYKIFENYPFKASKTVFLNVFWDMRNLSPILKKIVPLHIILILKKCFFHLRNINDRYSEKTTMKLLSKHRSEISMPWHRRAKIVSNPFFNCPQASHWETLI